MSNDTADQSWLEAKDNVEQVFKLIFGALVIFMQCGFGFLEAGAVRSKNTVNILMKNMNDCCENLISRKFRLILFKLEVPWFSGQ